MLRKLRSFTLITIVALLVWVFAETESLRRREVQANILLLADPASDRLVDISDKTWTGEVTIAADGTTEALDRFDIARQRGAIELRPGMIGVPSLPGEYSVDLRLALRAHRELTNSGVTIRDVQPQIVKIRVDRLMSKEVKVRVVVPGGQAEGTPESSPETAILRFPAAEADKVPDDAVVSAVLTEQDLGKLVTGTTETVKNVRLEPPLGLLGTRFVRIDPPSAEVTIVLRSRSATITLPSVPVHLKLAAAEQNRWDITIPEEDRFLKNVIVSGPAELVEQVKQGTITVTAVVPLSFEELERPLTAKEAVFGELPSQLSITAQDRLVRLEIRKRPSTSPENGS